MHEYENKKKKSFKIVVKLEQVKSKNYTELCNFQKAHIIELPNSYN